LNRPIGLLLNHCGSVPDLVTCDHIADLDLNQIAASQFAIDCQVKQRSIPQSSLSIQKEPDGPNLFLGERSLGPNGLSRIPSCAIAHRAVIS
jgi:hypothetical protein